jgi:hypothetical protein
MGIYILPDKCILLVVNKHRFTNTLNRQHLKWSCISTPAFAFMVIRDNVVGIATLSGLDGPGIESRLG